MTRLSSRQRQCLQALAEQGEWPARRGDFGWSGSAGQAGWAPKTRELLASLAALGLAADESTITVAGSINYSAGSLTRSTARARRYTITDKGQEAARRDKQRP